MGAKAPVRRMDVSMITPTGGENGARNGELLFKFKVYVNRTVQWKAFDSSTDFQLPEVLS